MTRIKICGITNLNDAMAAVETGADALGFVFAESPRRAEPRQAAEIISRLPPMVTTVGVFFNQELPAIESAMQESACQVVQLHGDEPAYYLEALARWPVIKSVRVRAAEDLDRLLPYGGARAFLLDTYVEGKPGGTGLPFDWNIAAATQRFKKPIILSGGLTCDNIAAALGVVRPHAVDVSSGVEAAAGKKDREKMRRFAAIVRAFDARSLEGP
jgi:phosphoribosylanthranilate isomerase